MPGLMTDTQAQGGMQTLMPRKSRAQTLSEVLAKGNLMGPLQGGTLGEGLARGGQAFFAARGAKQEQEREQQKQQMLASILSSSGDRNELWRKVAAVDPALGAQLMPKEQGLKEVSPGASLYDPGRGQSVFTAPSMPKDPKLPDGMQMGPDGKPVWIPNYLSGKQSIARAGVPGLPEGWGVVE